MSSKANAYDVSILLDHPIVGPRGDVACLGLPAKSLNPRSSLTRQVESRRRRLQQYGHLDRGRDRQQSFLQSSAVGPAARKTYHETVEPPVCGPAELGSLSRLFQDWTKRCMVPLNESFFDGEAGHVASKILAAVAHEWAGTTKGMKDTSRAVQGSRSWHRLSPATSRLPLPWLVVILLINEMIRLGILAAAQATKSRTLC